MEKNGKVLSLGQWPTRALPHHNIPLSPITKRILTQVHLEPQQILPITYQQFLKEQTSSQQSKHLLQQFKYEVERRKKQISILVEIRAKYISGKEYAYGSSKPSRIPSKLSQKQRVNSKQYQHQLLSHQSKSNRKTSRFLSRCRSQKSQHIHKTAQPKLSQMRQDHSPTNRKQQSDYFVHFDPRQHKSRIPSKWQQEDITHSSKKTKLQQNMHSQYGHFAKKHKIKPKEESRSYRFESSQQICEELLKTMAEWENLDKRHMKELSNLGGLSTKERQRLGKMQSMEKKAMGMRMKSLKSRLKSGSDLN